MRKRYDIKDKADDDDEFFFNKYGNKIEKELFKNITGKIKQEIQTAVQELKSKTKDEIVEERYQKFRKISGFKEV